MPTKERSSAPSGAASAPRRRQNRHGSDTREKLLDAAELEFANQGYEGTSLREISKKAGVHPGLSGYHYGSKAMLFDKVIERRAAEITRLRLEALAEIELGAQSTSATVLMLIRGYVTPFIEARYAKSRQWQAYVRLASGLVGSRRWAPLVRKHYDECSHAYFEHWRQVLPKARNNAILNTMSLMVASMCYVCAYPDRFGQWKVKSRSKMAEIEDVTSDFIRAFQASFLSLNEASHDAPVLGTGTRSGEARVARREGELV